MSGNPFVIWLVVGVIIFAIDRMQNKYNLVYAAYSAFMVAGFVLIGVMKTPAPGAPDYPYYNIYLVGQVIVFITACFIWRFVLRDADPKSKLGGKADEFYAKAIGKTVEVSAGGINSVSGGKVTYNGQVFQAKLTPNCGIESAKAGTKLQIDKVAGDTLILTILDEE